MKNLILFRRFYYFDHINDILQHILDYHNIKYTIKYELERNSEDVWLGIWNNVDNNILKNYIIFNIEPLKLSRWEDMFKLKLEKSLYIIDYSYSNIDIYDKLKINNYKIMPFGYCSYNETIYNTYKNNNNIKDIDILFYGSITDRRSSIIQDIIDLSIKHNLKFIIRNNNLFSYKEKIDLISRTKIVLSIASSEPILIQTNDLLRLSLLLSNKVFFITEKIGDKKIEDDILGNYIVYFSTIDELNEKIIYYINNENERIDKANKLYDYCKENLDVIKLFPVEEINNILKK